MKKPDYDKIIEQNAISFEKGMETYDFNKSECELGGNCFRDGFKQCLIEMSIDEMIDALIEVVGIMRDDGNGIDVSHKRKSDVFFKVKDSLKKAGCHE